MPNPLEYLDRAIQLAAAGKTAELQEELVQARREARAREDVIDDLTRENRSLKEKLRLSGEFIRREGALWLDGTKDPGPYCTACWDMKRDAIRISVSIGGANCPACNESYDLSLVMREKYGLPAVGQLTGMLFGIDVNLDRPKLR